MILRLPKKLFENKRFDILVALCFAVFFVVFAAAAIPEFYDVADAPDELGEGRTALLLGTSKYLSGGGENPYYANRIKTAAELYKSGVLKKIIASGDAGDDYYNEPKTMRADLIRIGVNPKDIFTDCSGTRTLNSVRRCSEIFKENSPVIISQGYHVRRALWLADVCGLSASGYAAADPDEITYRLRNGIREILARARALWDVCFLMFE